MINFIVAQPSDLADLLNLLELIGGDRSKMDTASFIVAKDDQKLVGCVRVKKFNDQSLELASLAVNPEYQRQGIGRTLVEKILEKEKSRPIFLFCSIEKEPFYTLNGFVKIVPEVLPSEIKKEYDEVLNRIKIPAEQVLIMACYK